MIQLRSTTILEESMTPEVNELSYFSDFSWHPARMNPSTGRQRSFLDAILPTCDTIREDYYSEVIPGR